MTNLADLQRDTGDLGELVNENKLVTTRYGGNKKSWQYLIDQFEAEFAEQLLEINKSRGYRVVGAFAAGFDYELFNDVGIDASGNSWVYVGSGAPVKTVTAGTVPSMPDYQQVTYNSIDGVVGLRDELNDRAIYLTLAGAQAKTDLVTGQRVRLTDHGDSLHEVVSDSDTGGIYKTGLIGSVKLKLVYQNEILLNAFGIISGASDNSAIFKTACETCASRGVDLLCYGNVPINFAEVNLAGNSIRIRGNAEFTSVGGSRLNMIRFINASGTTDIDEITINANDEVSQPLEILNETATKGDVLLGSGLKVLNTKTVAPLNHTAIGVRITGNIDVANVGCKVYDVDNTLTTNAASAGVATTPSGAYYCRSITFTDDFRVKNVTNQNTTVQDADGINIIAPADASDASLTVCSGAVFEDCRGRSIKSQVVNNSIDNPLCIRSLYDGISEVNLQFGGGEVGGVRAVYNASRVTSVVSVSLRDSPVVSKTTVKGVQLTVNGTPPSNTRSLVEFDLTSASADMRGVSVKDCSAHSDDTTPVNYMVRARVDSTANTNRVLVEDNSASSVGVAWFATDLYGSGRSNVNLIMNNNDCDTLCDGGDVRDDIYVISQKANRNISAIVGSATVISSDSISVFCNEVSINPESGNTDTISNITTNNIGHGELVTFRSRNSGNTITFTEGGNIYLVSGDFALSDQLDRLVLQYDATANRWIELARANN